MGFRNPVTSAGDLDTGAPFSARGGVRAYQDASGQFPTGVLEFYSDLAPPARLKARPLVLPQGGGAFTTVGSTTVLEGIADHGVPAPTLALNVEEKAAGGYASRAVLDTDRVTSRGVIEVAGERQITLAAANYRPGWSAWDESGYGALTFTRLPDGMVHVQGMTRWTPGATSASAWITQTGGPFAPDPDRGHQIRVCGSNVDGRAYFVEYRVDAGLRVNVIGQMPTAGWLTFDHKYRGVGI